MSRLINFLFFVSIILLSGCSSYRSFKLVNSEKQQHELIATKVQPTIEAHSEDVQMKSVFEEQQQEQQISSSPQLKEVKHLVVEQHTKVVQTVKKSATKLKEFIAHKKIQPSDNFWLDLIRDFLIFMLVAMIIVGIIAAMIVYGNPTIQLIGKVLGITLIVIGTIALLFS
jgi:hypothetical protein